MADTELVPVGEEEGEFEKDGEGVAERDADADNVGRLDVVE